MKKAEFDEPIMIIAFNRPESTERVFREVRKIKPKDFFLAVDGPRNKEEEKKVQRVRDTINEIDWECNVHTLFSDKNKGCLGGVSSAESWFFDNVGRGIILEDDAVPSPDFFSFCAEMLEKYKNDERIMHITGFNYKGSCECEDSYYFSRYPYTYGFASWRRAWKKQDLKMSNYETFKKKRFFRSVFPSFLERTYTKKIFDEAYSNDKVGPDTQWLFALASNNGLTIVPKNNMIEYIGFGPESTHTSSEDAFLGAPVSRMEFPLKHPKIIVRDEEKDRQYINWLVKNKIKKRIKRLLSFL